MNRLFRIITTLVIATGTANLLPAAPSPADVEELLGLYYKVHQGLATDALDTATTAAASLSKNVNAPADLTAAAEAVATASDLTAAREKFQELTNQMQALVVSVAIHGNSVYVARCPMAFSGKGGTWLQSDKTIANPYFGAKMPRCGRILKELGGSSPAGGATIHGSH